MPKRNLIFKPGETLPEGLRGFLLQHFDESQLLKLRKFGGRVQLSLTAPYTDRKDVPEDVDISSAYVETLKDNPSKAILKLKRLNVVQLKQVAKILGLPISSKSTKSETIQAVSDFLLSESRWKGIARPQQ